MGMALRKSSAFDPANIKRAAKYPKHELSIEDIRRRLGFDKIEPIKVTQADAKDMEHDLDYFKGWYEDELRELFEK